MTSGYLSEIFVSFQGEGLHVGERHLFVRLGGCNLRCRYCDTLGSLERTGGHTIWYEGRLPERGENPVAPPRLAATVEEFIRSGTPVDGLAITGGEPLVQADFLRDWLGLMRLPVNILLETNGVMPGALEKVISHIDVVSMDMKLPSNTGERTFWAEHESFLRVAGRRRVYVKIPLDGSTSCGEFERAARLVASVGRAIPVFLQPLSDREGKLEAGAAATLASFYATARCHLSDVRVMAQMHRLLGVR